MSQRKIVEGLTNIATKENVEAAIGLANIATPAAGLVVGIVGAVIVRAVNAAKDYINDTDQIPLIPPLTPHLLTFNESLYFLQQHNLDTAFKDEIEKSYPANNPSSFHIHEALVQEAATFLRKATDGDDPIFKAFFYGYIRNKNLLEIWKERESFKRFREKLKIAIPPARFTSMSRAIWKELTGQESKTELRSKIVDVLKEYFGEAAGSIDLNDLIETIGL